jgi:hypothetical protein
MLSVASLFHQRRFLGHYGVPVGAQTSMFSPVYRAVSDTLLCTLLSDFMPLKAGRAQSGSFSIVTSSSSAQEHMNKVVGWGGGGGGDPTHCAHIHLPQKKVRP